VSDSYITEADADGFLRGDYDALLEALSKEEQDELLRYTKGLLDRHITWVGIPEESMVDAEAIKKRAEQAKADKAVAIVEDIAGLVRGVKGSREFFTMVRDILKSEGYEV
jgi:hypothetical protein